MSNNNHNFNKIIDEVNCKIVINSFFIQEDEPIILEEVINHIKKSFTNQDKLAYHHYLYGHVNLSIMFNPDSIMVACQAVPAILNLFKPNIKPNTG